VQGRNRGSPGNVHSYPVPSPAFKATDGDFRLCCRNNDWIRRGSAEYQRNDGGYNAEAK
jgi:hypothetical protein